MKQIWTHLCYKDIIIKPNQWLIFPLWDLRPWLHVTVVCMHIYSLHVRLQIYSSSYLCMAWSILSILLKHLWNICHQYYFCLSHFTFHFSHISSLTMNYIFRNATTQRKLVLEFWVSKTKGQILAYIPRSRRSQDAEAPFQALEFKICCFLYLEDLFCLLKFKSSFQSQFKPILSWISSHPSSLMKTNFTCVCPQCWHTFNSSAPTTWLHTCQTNIP